VFQRSSLHEPSLPPDTKSVLMDLVECFLSLLRIVVPRCFTHEVSNGSNGRHVVLQREVIRGLQVNETVEDDTSHESIEQRKFCCCDLPSQKNKMESQRSRQQMNFDIELQAARSAIEGELCRSSSSPQNGFECKMR